jgi:hypothetical protein
LDYKIWIQRLTLGLLSLVILAGCATAASAPPPETLYLFDASDLAFNRYEHCIALTGSPDNCDENTPPPVGNSYADLLTDFDTLTLLSTLQGIVNRTAPRLYLLVDHPRGGSPGVDEFWLQTYQEPGQPYGWLADTQIIKLNSLEEVLQTFADELTGVVLWDPSVPATLNVATTIAGVENLPVLRKGSSIEVMVTNYLPVQKSLVGMFRRNAITIPNSDTPSTGSTKTDAYLWAKEQYLDTSRANPQFLAYLLDGWPATRYANDQLTRGATYAAERDYVVQQRGFAFDLSPWAEAAPIDNPNQPLGTDAVMLKTIVETAESRAGGDLIKIWGFIPWYEKYSSHVGEAKLPTEGEWESTWLFSQHGGYLQGGGGDVYGVSMANVSVHKFGPMPAKRPAPAPPTEADLIEQGYLTAEGRVAPDHTFVMFYNGDYDLAHPILALMGPYVTAAWIDPHRGDVPLAWGFNPGLVEDIPGVMTYLYATQTPQDYFVGANTGAGYLNPDALGDIALLRWLWRTHRYYADYGYDIQGFLLNGNGAQLSQRRLDAFTLLAPCLLSPEIQRMSRGPACSAACPSPPSPPNRWPERRTLPPRPSTASIAGPCWSRAARPTWPTAPPFNRPLFCGGLVTGWKPWPPRAISPI